MTTFLIEFRFQGSAKQKIKGLIYEVNRKFNITTKKTIPHITLLGPLTTRNERKLIGVFNNTCQNSKLMSFIAKDFGTFILKRVVYIEITPSDELDEFRWTLQRRLKSFCRLKPLDYKKKYYFHATIVKHLPIIKFIRISSYINKKPKIDFKHFVARVTLLKNGKILREYDFLLRRPLTRNQALSKRVLAKTINLIKNEKI